MSRLPRHLEHLKTGFTAEAVSAATFRAFAEQAREEGKPNLAEYWRKLALEKDGLAIEQLRAAGRIGAEVANLKSAIAEEQFENEVLYPRLIAAMEHLSRSDQAELLDRVMSAQKKHLESMHRVRRELTAAIGDLPAPG